MHRLVRACKLPAFADGLKACAPSLVGRSIGFECSWTYLHSSRVVTYTLWNGEKSSYICTWCWQCMQIATQHSIFLTISFFLFILFSFLNLERYIYCIMAGKTYENHGDLSASRRSPYDMLHLHLMYWLITNLLCKWSVSKEKRGKMQVGLPVFYAEMQLRV